MQFYSITNRESSNPEILIYKPIGSGFLDMSVSAKTFIDDVKTIKAKKLTIRLNSPGGSVFEGLSIYNYLRSSDKEITVIVDGIAASIASIILFAGDKRQIANGGMIMIHNPSGQIRGNSEQARKLADTLDKIRDQLVSIYNEHTGIEESKLIEMMNKETWFDAKEAKANKFVTEISQGLKAVACADLEQFPYTNLTNFTFPNTQTNQKENCMDEFLEILNAVDEKDGLKKLKAMHAENTSLKNQLASSTKIKNEKTIELLINQGKISANQKDFAEKMINENEDLFNSWVESNNPVTPPMQNLNVPEKPQKSKSKLTFDDLLEDPELESKTREENPELYNQLYNEYIGG